VAGKIQERLCGARARVAQASELLLCPTPEALEECALLLQAAAKIVAACHSDLDGSPERPKAALDEARQLKQAIGRARILLDAARDFHLNWAKRLGAMSGGYTSGGEPATLDVGHRLVLRG
jgi:hypothetical protein